MVKRLQYVVRRLYAELLYYVPNTGLGRYMSRHRSSEEHQILNVVTWEAPRQTGDLVMPSSQSQQTSFGAIFEPHIKSTRHV